MKKLIRNNKGVSVVEVLIALSMGGILVVSIGGVLASVHNNDVTSELREKALGYARQSLEIVTEIKNQEFACECTSSGGQDICTGNTCTKSNDAQVCTLPSAYTSCWTQYRHGLVSNSPLHIVSGGFGWQLAAGSEIISTDPIFSRDITIVNLQRDVDGNIVESGGTVDPNTKKTTVTVSWTERGNAKEVSLSTILTAWENL
ncbi:type II secretion system protein J [Patescibacteria group bacterium]